MNLGQLLKDLIVIQEEWQGTEISSIETDSRRAHSGALFVCLKGPKQDGHAFVNDAIQKGCRAILVDPAHASNLTLTGVCLLAHADPVKILPVLLNRLHHQPCETVHVIGITGTNGKTTTTYLVEAIYESAGRRCGVIGTVNYRFAGKVLAAKNTTPGVVDNFSHLSQMREAGMEACVMEVSSHALVQRRVAGLCFQEAVFTNLTSDHLDYHETQEDYFLAKALLFDGSYEVRQAIINIDDPFGPRLTKMSAVPVITYGIAAEADIRAVQMKMDLSGSRFDLVTPQGMIAMTTPLMGKHNVYNILAAAGISLNEGFSLKDIQQGVAQLAGVPGRLERIDQGQPFSVFVDYAHTEDALQNVLMSIRELKPSRILVLFGCGGDRDKIKRPKMAAVVERYADVAIVTNDNPRTEDPQAIVEDIKRGFQKTNYEVVLDRELAIQKILNSAGPGDCVLIAGKGHEDYQIFKDRTIHFDDREICRFILKGLR
ncbi:MAG TPA: UDP-N-acetylmuramoyl-L-alanyl-D-glutamate--2,6-diaminopimelate ligase [Candidatus Bathyarchaeia archaeon]|nr:UDP-N-acetylmuramoyl-L-alanyl-D-glutamate--2,6-diaminopimelate ligase [Candidatus Bathyarchaeia archaeon]